VSAKGVLKSENRYPGLVVLEGLEQDTDEFVARIKRLQWQGAHAEVAKMLLME
jgi:hypothetical protein